LSRRRPAYDRLAPPDSRRHGGGGASAGAKFKPPFRFIVSALRAVGADTHAHAPLIDYLVRMGQGVFEYPTPDGYPDEASPWMGTLLWRWNFSFALAAGEEQIALLLASPQFQWY